MPPVNTRTAAVVDPILSTHARGYRNAEFISHLLFPRVTVPNRSMRTLKFGKESFRMMNTRRAPGATKLRVQYGYASDPISLVQDALEGVVPIEHQEEAMSVPGIDLGQGAINMVLDVVDLGLEFECAQMARTLANYATSNRVTLTTTARWTDAASTPRADIKEGNEVIRRMTGRYANTLILGPNAKNALTDHASIKDQFKYTSAQSITLAMLAAALELENVVVGKAVYLPETAADTVAATDVWGDDAILAYVPTGSNYQVPAYGYTYELSGYPQVEQPYFERANDSWIYPTKTERRPYIVGADAGFLFQNAGQG
ncbi:major capsid protein [Gemmobacter sp.]|uniref:major capsid protein n=1 Tax=Gemmobacter sp. TaxID=1898957 RepID=UPI002AFEFD0A|nr:major capsid protein [Gemmobacter sp.]